MRIGLGIGLQYGRRAGGGAAAPVGILDSYTGAAFAAALDVLIYGAHSVTDNAVGSATNGQTGQYTVRVRRSSDNAVSSFTYTEVSDGTLTTWVGAGNDGFVEAWYEQSTNGNHATQSTAANQPKIVDAGSLVVENGKAALRFDGVDDFITSPMDEILSDFSIFATLKTSRIDDTAYAYRYTFPTSGFLFRTSTTPDKYVTFFDDGIESFIQGDRAWGEYWLSSNIYNNETFNMYSNGVSFASGTDAYNTTSINRFSIGRNPQTVTQFFQGLMGTIIAFATLPSRTAIETAINTEYTIY